MAAKLKEAGNGEEKDEVNGEEKEDNFDTSLFMAKCVSAAPTANDDYDACVCVSITIIHCVWIWQIPGLEGFQEKGKRRKRQRI